VRAPIASILPIVIAPGNNGETCTNHPGEPKLLGRLMEFARKRQIDVVFRLGVEVRLLRAIDEAARDGLDRDSCAPSSRPIRSCNRREGEAVEGVVGKLHLSRPRRK
jgi:hypothetical protein